MDFFYSVIEFFKGSNGTWPQTIVVTTVLNFRFWVFLILIFLLNKTIKNKSIFKFIIN